HVDKAAGSSVARALDAYAFPESKKLLHRRLIWLRYLNRFGGLYRKAGFPPHVTARVVKQCLPARLYQSAFKFAFVRNPWDRLVSRYTYLLRQESHHSHEFVKRMKGFEEYLDWEIRRGKMSQADYVTDGRGELIVDFIGHYERLNDDFEKICAHLGIQASLPRVNVSKHQDYRSYYTARTRDAVAKHFRKDLELFGYDFDGFA